MARPSRAFETKMAKTPRKQSPALPAPVRRAAAAMHPSLQDEAVCALLTIREALLHLKYPLDSHMLKVLTRVLERVAPKRG